MLEEVKGAILVLPSMGTDSVGVQGQTASQPGVYFFHDHQKNGSSSFFTQMEKSKKTRTVG